MIIGDFTLSSLESNTRAKYIDLDQDLTMAIESTQKPANKDLFQALESYPWDSDQEYQHGLQAILGSDPDQEQAKHLIMRAKCFYYAR